MRLPGFLALFALVFAGAASAQPTTYTLQSAPYSPTDFTAPCAIAPCANFPAGSQITGSFTTNGPLSPNLVDANIVASVTAFSFDDGIQVYDNSLADVRVFTFIVTTNGAGAITTTNLQFQRWKTGSAPHGTSDRFSTISLSAGFFATAQNNLGCTTVGNSPAGVGDSCTAGVGGTSTSVAVSNSASFVGPPQPPQPPSVAAIPVPTSSELSLALLALGIATIAWMRRRSASRPTA